MLLSSHMILEYVRGGQIEILPGFDENQLRPFGLRVHLGARIMRLSDGQDIDLADRRAVALTETHDIRESGLSVRPGDFVLASTAESVKVDPHICCRLDGRSTLARLGISVHCNASTIDGNHNDYRAVVLEITNVGPCTVRIPYLHPIAMLMFDETTRAADVSLEQPQYQGQREVRGPNLVFSPTPYAPPAPRDL
jgi:dCTP deaminase